MAIGLCFGSLFIAWLTQLLLGLGFVVLSAEHGTCIASVTTQKSQLGVRNDAQSVPAPSFGKEMCLHFVG